MLGAKGKLEQDKNLSFKSDSDFSSDFTNAHTHFGSRSQGRVDDI